MLLNVRQEQGGTTETDMSVIKRIGMSVSVSMNTNVSASVSASVSIRADQSPAEFIGMSRVERL